VAVFLETMRVATLLDNQCENQVSARRSISRFFAWKPSLAWCATDSLQFIHPSTPDWRSFDWKFSCAKPGYRPTLFCICKCINPVLALKSVSVY